MLLHLGKYDTYTYSNGVYNISRYTGNNSGKNYTSTSTTSSGRATYMYGNDICNSDYAKLILNVDFEARGTGYWWNVTDLDDTKWYISYVEADSTIVIIPPVGETPNDVSFWYKKSACFNEVYNTGYYHKY